MIDIRDRYSMDGKICVVTGGSTGLGSYMAEGFLAAGAAKVYITARTEATLETKASELSGTYEGECRCHVVQSSGILFGTYIPVYKTGCLLTDPRSH